jgi:predicted  nucleic acid-binding Zn-ribbon protein
MSSIQKSTKDKNAAMQKELADKRSALDDVIAKIEETNSVYEDYRHKVEQALNEKLSAFRQSNKKSRTNPVPKYFKEKVKLS